MKDIYMKLREEHVTLIRSVSLPPVMSGKIRSIFIVISSLFIHLVRNLEYWIIFGFVCRCNLLVAVRLIALQALFWRDNNNLNTRFNINRNKGQLTIDSDF